MRPPRRVLLVDSKEDRAAITRYVLRQRYVVLSASSVIEAQVIAEADDVDVVLGYWPIDEVGIVHLARKLDRGSIFIVENESQRKNLAEATPDATLQPANSSMAELLERIHILTCRKCGWKKGRLRKPVASVHPSTDIALSA